MATIRRRYLGYVFQSYNLTSLTSLENVVLPLIFAGTPGGKGEAGKELLRELGLGDRMQTNPRK